MNTIMSYIVLSDIPTGYTSRSWSSSFRGPSSKSRSGSSSFRGPSSKSRSGSMDYTTLTKSGSSRAYLIRSRNF